MINNISKDTLSRKVSFFINPIKNKTPKEDWMLSKVYDYIVNDVDLKKITDEYRKISDADSKKKFKMEKFPHITPSGVFSYGSDKSLISHSEIICIDIDNLDEIKLSQLRARMIRDTDHTIMCFISPSGNGLKVFYAMDSTKYTQKEWYMSYRQYVIDFFHISEEKIDTSCSNVSRSCFLCSDKTAYFNPNMIDGEKAVYMINPDEYLKEEEQVVTSNSEPLLYNNKLDHSNPNSEENFLALYSITEAKEGVYSSPRQPWIHKLACRCNKFGMSERYCLVYIIKHIASHPESIRKDKPMDEKGYIYTTIKDVYVRYKNDFGTWTKDSGMNKNSPMFPSEVYDNLPEFLKTFLNLFLDREKDVVFVGALGLLSAAMPDVRGYYAKEKVSANLYFFISAKAASGKGVLNFVKIFGEEIHFKLNEEYKIESDYYEKKVIEYKKFKDKPKPEEPKKGRFFIPGNISSSAMFKALSDNNGRGLIFETEADTLSESLKQDWGNFSYLLRNAFHHEFVSQMRRSNEEDLELRNPALSLVLSGTPNQLTKLIPNPENGLMSRFAFYVYDKPRVWNNVFEDNDESHYSIFKQLSLQVKTMYDIFNKGNEIKFMLTPVQKSVFNERFDLWTDHSEGSLGASIFRLGLITFRICMILTAIRWFDKADYNDFGELVCNDEDFNTALLISEVLRDHTQIVLGESPIHTKDIGFREMEKICGVSKSKIQRLYQEA